VGKGAATGATAFAAGQIGQALQGAPGSVDTVQWSRNGIPFSATVDNGKVVGDIVFAAKTFKPGDADYAEAAKAFLKAAGKEGMLGSVKNMSGAAANFSDFKDSIDFIGQHKLSEGQVYLVFNQIVGAQLDEGVFDKIKTIGKNLTTKVTVDKLNSAWKKAGSPLDSNEVVAVLRKAGVSDQVLAPVLKSMKIKMPQAAVSKPDNVAKTEPNVSSNAADNTDTLDYKSLQAAVAQLRTRDAKSLVAHIDKIDGVAQASPAATTPKTTVQLHQKLK
jgi:hypothetical protein